MTDNPAQPVVRVIDLETAGNGAGDVCEIGWQDVVQGINGLWAVSETSRGARFVNPGRPISPDTMAVHHILDEWVADAPFWKDVAPSVLRPDTPVAALAAHRAAFEQRFCTPVSVGARPGSAPGNAPCGSGRSCPDFPIRCCATSAGPRA